MFADNSSTDYVTTNEGNLVITTRAHKTSYLEWDGRTNTFETRTKNYTSGMVQSWNKFCFTGGVLEMSIELPGKADSGGNLAKLRCNITGNGDTILIFCCIERNLGLWPAAWLMGNLARATFEKSTMVSLLSLKMICLLSHFVQQ